LQFTTFSSSLFQLDGDMIKEMTPELSVLPYFNILRERLYRLEQNFQFFLISTNSADMAGEKRELSVLPYFNYDKANGKPRPFSFSSSLFQLETLP